MKEIRCLFIASYYGPYYGNFVASILALEREMQQRKYQMSYIFPEAVREFEWIHLLEKQTDRIFYLPYRPYSYNNYHSIKLFIKENQINLIYSNMCGWDITAHLAAPFVPVIWHMHMNVNVTTTKKRIKNWIKFHVLGFGQTYHIAVSNPVADAINSLKPKHHCVPIENAIDPIRLHPKTASFSDGNPTKLLIFGWAPVVKGLDITLDACEKLNKEQTTYTLLVSAQEKTYQYIENRYGKEIPQWLSLLPPTDHIAELYDEADIMISASRTEGFSYALAEAIYSGLPVVYSDIAGTSWADAFEKTHKFHSGDSEDLVRAIWECSEQGITADERNKNIERMEKHYSMKAWAEKVIAFFEKI